MNVRISTKVSSGLNDTRSFRRSNLCSRLSFSSGVSGALFSSNFKGWTSFCLLRFAMVSAKEKAGFVAVGAAVGAPAGPPEVLLSTEVLALYQYDFHQMKICND